VADPASKRLGKAWPIMDKLLLIEPGADALSFDRVGLRRSAFGDAAASS
jgi:hypothetical protein